MMIFFFFFFKLREHAYSNTLYLFPQKHEDFHLKNFDIFLISAQNIDGYSLEPPRTYNLTEIIKYCLPL